MCANCGAPLSGPYCAHCGQSTLDIDRPVWRLASESIVEIFGVEGRLVRSLRLLAIRPGELTAEYCAGRRARYTAPARLYLVASAAFFVVFRLTRPTDQAYYGTSGAVDATYYDALTVVFILLLPALAIVLRLLYIGYGRSTLYGLVFSLHTGAAALFWALTLTSVAFALKVSWQHHTGAPPVLPDFAFWLYLPGAVLFLVYATVALRRTYGSGWVGSAVRVTLITASFTVGFWFVLPLVRQLQDLVNTLPK